MPKVREPVGVLGDLVHLGEGRRANEERRTQGALRNWLVGPDDDVDGVGAPSHGRLEIPELSRLRLGHPDLDLDKSRQSKRRLPLTREPASAVAGHDFTLRLSWTDDLEIVKGERPLVLTVARDQDGTHGVEGKARVDCREAPCAEAEGIQH